MCEIVVLSGVVTNLERNFRYHKKDLSRQNNELGYCTGFTS